MAVDSGSGGHGRLGARAAARLAGDERPRRRIAGKTGFWGYRAPFGPGFGRGDSRSHA